MVDRKRKAGMKEVSAGQEGRKDDSRKPDWSLVERETYNELLAYTELFDAEFRTYDSKVLNVESVVEDMLSRKMYMAACAVVFHFKHVTIEDVLRIYSAGAVKYARHNWKFVRPIDRYVAAAYRHMCDGINTEDFGETHWAHFCWNMFTLRWFEKNGIITEAFEQDNLAVRSRTDAR